MIGQTEGGTYEVLQDARRTLEEEGKLLAKVYNEPSIFELEAKKIFSKTWVFLAHETEIPWPRVSLPAALNTARWFSSSAASSMETPGR